MKKLLILGINGFIGNQLTKKILATTNWEIYGMDLVHNKLEHSITNPRLHFTQGDITTEQKWLNQHIEKCDVILPLAAIATPAIYVTNPLQVFELDFEANLPIVRQCVQSKKHLIFPSTSEVYGLSTEQEFAEETTILMQGPINKERWIYSCAKQLMDRIIYAYGKHSALKYTLFRPFNWIGPTQDDIHNKNLRLVPQFISNIIYGRDLQLVNGGEQRRCFTFIDDAVAALIKIIANKNDCATNNILNIGNPNNNASIREVAETMLQLAKKYPQYKNQVTKIKIVNTQADDYYGDGYQDVQNRVPAIKHAQKFLNWQPTTNLKTALEKTMDYYLC